MNQKGSKKDRLKAWWIVFFYKRKKEKEEKKKEVERLRIWKEQNKGKFYSNPKVILLTVLGLFLGFLEPSTSKKQKQEEKLIKIEIKKDPSLEKKIEQIKEEIIVLQKQIEKEQVVEQVIEKEEKLVQKEEELEILEEKVHMQNPTLVPVKKIDPSKPVVNKQLLEDHKKIKSILEETEDIRKTIDDKKEISYLLLQREKMKEKQKELDPYQKKYKETNIISVSKTIPKNMLLIEESQDNIKKIIKNTDQSIEQIEALLQIKKETFSEMELVKDTEEKQSDLPKDFYAEKEEVVEAVAFIDLSNIEEIVEETVELEVLAICVLTVEKIEEKISNEKTKEICQKQKQKALDKIEEQSKKEIPKKREEEDLSEILYMEALVYNNILKQKNDLRQLAKRMEAALSNEYKRTFLGSIMNFMNHNMRLTFSIFPFFMFRNKNIGRLTSTILINNSIRNMRKALGNQEINYIHTANIAKKIKKSKNELEIAKDICFDSLHQITNLKKEFIKVFGHEIVGEAEEVFNQMNQLQEMLYAQTVEIQKKAKKFDKIQEKNKQKIKKRESYSGV